MQPISAVLITRNEERDIGRTLDALAFVDEIVVVDSGSTDRTIEICRARGARVVSEPFRGYGPQKRFAVAQASHDWVLCIDADEVVDPELAAAAHALRCGDAPACAAYALSFRTVFMGRPLLHGARETHVRLFDRRRAAWTDALVHERVVVHGPVGRLPGVVLHESTRDIAETLEKLNRYTSRAAQDRRVAPPRGAGALLATGAWHFFRHFVLKRQFLNGVPGFGWSMLFAVGSVVKHLKVYERAGDVEELPAAAEVAEPVETGASAAL